jgi:hypothetical protein
VWKFWKCLNNSWEHAEDKEKSCGQDYILYILLLPPRVNKAEQKCGTLFIYITPKNMQLEVLLIICLSPLKGRRTSWLNLNPIKLCHYFLMLVVFKTQSFLLHWTNTIQRFCLLRGKKALSNHKKKFLGPKSGIFDLKKANTESRLNTPESCLWTIAYGTPCIQSWAVRK